MSSSPENPYTRPEIEPAREELPGHFEALIVLGKNWRKVPDAKMSPDTDRIHLSLESKMTARAALEMYLDGKTDKIILAGGKTAGKDWPSEAQAMADYMTKIYRAHLGQKDRDHSKETTDEMISLFNQSLIIEDQSIDTKTNADEVSRILTEHNLNNAALITVGFHLGRAEQNFQEQGIEAQGFKSEDVMKQYTPELYERFYEHQYQNSPREIKQRVLEAIVKKFLTLNRSENPFSKRFRHGKPPKP